MFTHGAALDVIAPSHTKTRKAVAGPLCQTACLTQDLVIIVTLSGWALQLVAYSPAIIAAAAKEAFPAIIQLCRPMFASRSHAVPKWNKAASVSA